MKKTVRLVKVLVQPVFVIDNGDTLEEVEHPMVAIPATEWPEYSNKRFPREVAEWEHQLNEPPNKIS